MTAVEYSIRKGLTVSYKIQHSASLVCVVLGQARICRARQVSRELFSPMMRVLDSVVQLMMLKGSIFSGSA